jgi:hypothetical protein
LECGSRRSESESPCEKVESNRSGVNAGIWGAVCPRACCILRATPSNSGRAPPASTSSSATRLYNSRRFIGFAYTSATTQKIEGPFVGERLSALSHRWLSAGVLLPHPTSISASFAAPSAKFRRCGSIRSPPVYRFGKSSKTQSRPRPCSSRALSHPASV